MSLDARLLIDTLGVVAIRLDDDLCIREIWGVDEGLETGGDIREAMPVLYGLEDVLAEADVDLAMPFIQTGRNNDEPVSLSIRRDPSSGALWVLRRDVSEESEIHRQLVQNHNSLSLAQAELVKARDAAQEADRTKTAFLANVSHELRTPLHVIIGGASILSRTDEKRLDDMDEVTDYAKDIHESGVLLLQLVDDLIDLSRSETGDLSIYEESCDLCAIASGIVSLCRELPEARGTRIDATLPDLPVGLMGDSRRIKQVLLNLLSNAVKAVAGRTDATITVAIDPEGPRLVVSDNGPGMTADELAIARKPFGQPRAAVRAKGAGLGLAIVHRLVDLHGGTVEIHTAPNEGLIATISFDPARARPLPDDR